MLFLLAAEEGAEHGAEEAATNPIIPDVAEMFWTLVFFFLLLALVNYVFLPPIRKVMDERAERIRDDLAAAEADQAKAASASGELADELADVRAEAHSVIDAARAEAMAQRAELVGAAEADVAAMRAEAEAEIATARATAMAAIGPQVGDVAAQAASQALGRTVDIGSVQPLVDRHLANPN